MADGRPAIPAELRRRVLVEAGHRCAVPACRQHPVEIEHIEDWAKVQTHEFENLIALCPTCHARKGDRPGQIDRKSLRLYKANLAVMNSRYGDVERRLIEAFAAKLAAGAAPGDQIAMGPGSEISLWYLIRDGYLKQLPWTGGRIVSGGATLPVAEIYQFTPAGVEFVQQWADAQPLDPE
ncbi:hypothetical protein ABH930_000301 [Kitasatospora sp. GAS204A]|uniref:HNH endonuclease n=1 Tax=unclassified Kitasatospora TaxID=2633591 RepID=UPI002474470B|nr:HNH endonuclease [Kitasatospora sp. GAS204B]MDH6116882.1 hypothetical protein [Kitasatospora sp. GAS204B]